MWQPAAGEDDAPLITRAQLYRRWPNPFQWKNSTVPTMPFSMIRRIAFTDFRGLGKRKWRILKKSFQGIYSRQPHGEVTLVTDLDHPPNGIEASSGNSKDVYCSDGKPYWYLFDRPQKTETKHHHLYSAAKSGARSKKDPDHFEHELISLIIIFSHGNVCLALRHLGF